MRAFLSNRRRITVSLVPAVEIGENPPNGFAGGMMLKRLGKFITLPLQTQWLLFKVAAVLLAIHLSLRFLPFRSVYRFASASQRSIQTRSEKEAFDEGRLIWAITRLSLQLLGQESCLRQALTGLYFFSRAGMRVSLRIGVRKGMGDAVLAHAWIERDGKVLLGGTDNLLNHFIRLPDLDPVLLKTQTGMNHEA